MKAKHTTSDEGNNGSTQGTKDSDGEATVESSPPEKIDTSGKENPTPPTEESTIVARDATEEREDAALRDSRWWINVNAQLGQKVAVQRRPSPLPWSAKWKFRRAELSLRQEGFYLCQTREGVKILSWTRPRSTKLSLELRLLRLWSRLFRRS